MNQFLYDIKVRKLVHDLIKPTIEKSNEIMTQTVAETKELKIKVSSLEKGMYEII